MSSGANVAMRFSSDDKARLRELAARVQLSQTAVVRLLVRGAFEALMDGEVKAVPGASFRATDPKSDRVPPARA